MTAEKPSVEALVERVQHEVRLMRQALLFQSERHDERNEYQDAEFARSQQEITAALDSLTAALERAEREAERSEKYAEERDLVAQEFEARAQKAEAVVEAARQFFVYPHLKEQALRDALISYDEPPTEQATWAGRLMFPFYCPTGGVGPP